MTQEAAPARSEEPSLQRTQKQSNPKKEAQDESLGKGHLSWTEPGPPWLRQPAILRGLFAFALGAEESVRDADPCWHCPQKMLEPENLILPPTCSEGLLVFVFVSALALQLHKLLQRCGARANHGGHWSHTQGAIIIRRKSI